MHSTQGFGRPPERVRLDVRRDDAELELLGEVEDVMVDPEPGRDPAGVVDVADRAAARVACPAPELHRGADDVVALLEQERGRDRGVDPARKPDQHSHRASLAEPPGGVGAQIPCAIGRRGRSGPQPLHGLREGDERRVDVARRRVDARGRVARGAWPPLASAPSRAGRGSARWRRSRTPILPRRTRPSSSRTTSSSSASTPSTPRLQIGVDAVVLAAPPRARPEPLRRCRRADAVESSRTRRVAASRSRARPLGPQPPWRRLRPRSACPPGVRAPAAHRGAGAATVPPRRAPPRVVTSAPTPFGPPNL